jgi:hypothetical protein
MASLRSISDRGSQWASSPSSEIFGKVGHLRSEVFHDSRRSANDNPLDRGAREFRRQTEAPHPEDFAGSTIRCN